MNCFLFDATPRRSTWPAEFGIGVGSDAETGSVELPDRRLPEGWTVGRTKKAILGIHPRLRAAWGRGLGYRLMFVESEVLVAVMTALMARGIAALGLHDGVLVAQSKASEAEGVMREQAKLVTGLDLPVSIKG